MLEKLATHEVESVTTLFSLADKCARAAEGRAWHSPPRRRRKGWWLRGYRPGRWQEKEVRKLLHAGFIEEVYHPEWLANPVVVPKANGKLRMCIDYTSLKRHVLETPILFHVSIRSWTLPPGVTFCLF